MKPLLAVIQLTLKAAIRVRLVVVLALLLVGSVVILPLVIKDDGTAEGFTQILLSYTLMVITALLGLATLWLGCGSVAREVQECQIQMVVVKPIPRWKVWLGKWLGIMALNFVLLAASSATVYGLTLWRSERLPAAQQEILRNKIFVARGSAKEEIHDTSSAVNQIMADRLKQNPDLAGMDRAFVRTQIEEQVKSAQQIVRPGYRRRWEIHLGSADRLKDAPMFLRIKFYTTKPYDTSTYKAFWEIGPPEGRQRLRREMDIAPESPIEFSIPPNMFDADGVLTIDLENWNKDVLLFPLEDGMEVLYREGGFGLNFARGMGIIFCWLGFLTALGLAASSFLSFPVAAFCSVALLIVGFSTGVLNQVITEGGITGVNHETGFTDQPTFLDPIAVAVAKGLLKVINVVKDFSPVDNLSTGRSITWSQLAQAFGQIIVLMGGLVALAGVAIFTRRELATAQSTP